MSLFVYPLSCLLTMHELAVLPDIGSLSKLLGFVLFVFWPPDHQPAPRHRPPEDVVFHVIVCLLAENQPAPDIDVLSMLFCFVYLFSGLLTTSLLAPRHRRPEGVVLFCLSVVLPPDHELAVLPDISALSKLFYFSICVSGLLTTSLLPDTSVLSKLLLSLRLLAWTTSLLPNIGILSRFGVCVF